MIPSLQQRELLRQRHAEGDPWAGFCPWFVAEAPGNGWEPTLPILMRAYDATGDHAILEQIAAFPMPEHPTDRNHSRNEGHLWPLLFKYASVYMTTPDAAEWGQRLDNWAKDMLAHTRLTDSDEVVGHYLGLACTDHVLGTSYLATTEAMLVGGKGPHNSTPAQMKQAIEGFIARSKGGVWLEGSSYNLNTLMLLMNGVAVLGLDHFQGLREFLPELARYLRWSVTDDFKDCEQHGDIDAQYAHSCEWHYRLPLMMQVSALGGDIDGELVKMAAAVTAEVKTPYDVYNFGYMGLCNALWLDFDPGLLRKQDAYFPPRGTFVAEGYGLVIHRTDSTFLQIRLHNRTLVDHDGDAGSRTGGWGDVRWRYGAKGEPQEWILDHPIGYDRPVTDFNTGIPCGVDMLMNREFIDAVNLEDGCQAWGRMKTPYVIPGTFTELTFLNAGWQRTVEYTEDGGPQLTINDSYEMQDPLPAHPLTTPLFEQRTWVPVPVRWVFPDDPQLPAYARWLAGGHVISMDCTWNHEGYAPGAIEEATDGWEVISFTSEHRKCSLVTTISVGERVIDPVPPPPPPPPPPPSVSLQLLLLNSQVSLDGTDLVIRIPLGALPVK